MVKKNGLGDFDIKELEGVNDALIHRGPDSHGMHIFENSALAMRRLSIIDLEYGNQPLFNETGEIVLIANAEIYNYKELREKLENTGHLYSTSSDCESIIHAYEEYGNDFLNELRGMFAFALLDKKNRKIILCRDRIGEKPLYTYFNEMSFCFSSELKSILKFSHINLDLDPVSINQYFHFGYVPEPGTPVCGVSKLPAGCYYEIGLKDFNYTLKRYWSLDNSSDVESEPVEGIYNELNSVMDIILRSDVPVGISLSAGVDSSVIACMMADRHPAGLQAFTVGYTDYSGFCDESEEARNLSEKLNIPFNKVELSVSDMIEAFEEMNYYRDDPIADISGSCYYAVMKKAKEKNVPVILQGHGGDEFFWGYPWYHNVAKNYREWKTTHNSKFLKKILWSARYIWKQLLSCRGIFFMPSKGKLKKWIQKKAGINDFIYFFRIYWNHVRLFFKGRMPFWENTPDYNDALLNISKYYSKNFNRSIKRAKNGCLPEDLFSVSLESDSWKTDIIRAMVNSYLVENGIAQTDRLSMANSIELRLPFVDYRLIEKLNGFRKIYDDVSLPAKQWLKDVVLKIIPPEVLEKPKRGFSPPSHLWMDALYQKYAGYLLDGELVQRSVLSRKGAKKLNERKCRNDGVFSLCYKALVLELWLRSVIQKLDTHSIKNN